MSAAATVLAIDDNEMNLRIILESLGDQFDVLTASNGREGLQLAITHRPRVVLLDIMMPVMDGYEVCSVLRSRFSREACGIILVSAKYEIVNRLKGFHVGANGFIAKPFDDEELLGKIHKSMLGEDCSELPEEALEI